MIISTRCGVIKPLLTVTVVFATVQLQSIDALLISGESEASFTTSNVSGALSFRDSAEEMENHSSSENSVLTTPQGIRLKEIRKLARLAGHEHPESITDFEEELCYKNDCLDAAVEFYTSMDFSKNPCTEWPKFACEWRTLSSKSSLDQWSALALTAENQVVEILRDPFIETETVVTAQEYYKACIAWFQGINKVGHIKNYLQRFGKWPLLDGTDFTGDWVKVLAEIVRISPENVTPFLFKFVASAVGDNKIILQIDAGSTTFETDAEDLHEIFQLLRNGSSIVSSSYDNEIRGMRKCMRAISAAKFDSSVENAASVITLKELQEQLSGEIPNFKNNVVSFVQAVFTGTDVKISDSTEVLVNAEHLIKYFTVIADTTSIMEESNFSYFDYYKSSQRSLSRNPSRQCLAETSEIFSYALSDEYIRRYYNQETDETVHNIVENLKAGFNITIASIKWLEAPSQMLLKEKIKRIEPLIGFSKWIQNNDQIRSYYLNLKLTVNVSDTGAYLKYRYKALAWMNGKSWIMKLNDEPMNGWNWKQKNGFVGDTNVEYIPSLNQIRIPAGALQLPLYSSNLPGYMNFGGLGSIIAKEMARVMDPIGIQTNSEGDLGMLLDEKSLKNYFRWSNQLQVDWELESKMDVSLHDKIIHIITYHITINGYKEFLKSLTKKGLTEIKLPGLDKTQPEILALIKYTNVRCESDQINRVKRERDNPSFGKYGIIPVTQTKIFTRLFECEDVGDNAFDLL